jgi:hypothetical protein
MPECSAAVSGSYTVHVNLKVWAEQEGVAYVTARRWLAGGNLPVPARKAGGPVLDRDQNAAVNLLHLAVSGTERMNACGPQVRPGPAGHSRTKQEPGTAQAGKTGTASRQRKAAA